VGVVVESVQPGELGDLHGIKEGDIILAVCTTFIRDVVREPDDDTVSDLCRCEERRFVAWTIFE
jgi:hypothetical protein